MPSIHCFTPSDIRKLYIEAGFVDVEIIGFPNLIYPNIEDTMVIGQNSKNKKYLRE